MRLFQIVPSSMQSETFAERAAREAVRPAEYVEIDDDRRVRRGAVLVDGWIHWANGRGLLWARGVEIKRPGRE